MSKIFKGPARKVSMRNTMYFETKDLAKKARQSANSWIRYRQVELGQLYPDIKVTVKYAGEDGWAVVFTMYSEDNDVFGMVDRFIDLYDHTFTDMLRELMTEEG